jgi:hypothetical protein
MCGRQNTSADSIVGYNEIARHHVQDSARERASLMTADVHEILNAARSLPPQEQLELLQGIAQSLAQTWSPLAAGSAAFWRHATIEELARGHPAALVTDLRSLAMPTWPDDETADDIIEFVREQRHADRTA